MEAVQDAPHLEIASLTGDIMWQSLAMTAVPEMHDRLIVATASYLQAQGHNVFLITKDREIIASNTITIVWE